MPDEIIPTIEGTSEGLSTKDIPRVQNVWTYQQRVYLCVLCRRFENSKEEKCQLFNRIFQDELQRRGFLDGLPVRTFETQWNDLRKKNHLIEKHVTSDISMDLGIATSMIELMASKDGIGLVPEKPRKIKPDFILWPKPRSNDVRLTSKNDIYQNGPDTGNRHQDDIDIDSSPRQGLCQRDDGQNVLPAPQLTPNSQSQQQRVRGEPELLFRAWNADSMGINSPEGFVAGMWASDPAAGAAVSGLDSETFDKYARWHFEREKKATPFISVFEALRAAVHRAVRKHPASVTVFDMSAFPREKITYGEDWVSNHPLSEEARNGHEYRGYGEYVVLGNIDRCYIVATFTTEQLERIEEEDEEIGSLLHLHAIQRHWINGSRLRRCLAAQRIDTNGRSGIILGRLLYRLRIPQGYVGALAISFSKSWLFQSSKDNYKSFLRGVHSGYSQGTIPQHLAPPATQQSDPEIPQEMEEVDECDPDAHLGREQYSDDSDDSDDNGDMMMMDFIEKREDVDSVVPLCLPRSDEQRRSVVNTSKLFSLDRQRVNEAMGW